MNEIAIVVKSDYISCLEMLKNKKMKFDLIFLDPPYKTDFAVEAIRKILSFNLLTKESIIIVETDEEEIISKIELLDVKINDVRKYGRAKLMFLSRKV